MSEITTTVSADQLRCQDIFPAELRSVTASSFQFNLYKVELFRWNNGRMGVADIVLSGVTLIFLYLLGQIINDNRFLKQGVALVFLIPQDSGFDTMCAVGANGCKWVHGVGASEFVMHLCDFLMHLFWRSWVHFSRHGCKWVQMGAWKRRKYRESPAANLLAVSKGATGRNSYCLLRFPLLAVPRTSSW